MIEKGDAGGGDYLKKKKYMKKLRLLQAEVQGASRDHRF